MKTKPLVVFKDVKQATKFVDIIFDKSEETGKLIKCKIVIEPELIKIANFVRNLKIRNQFLLMKKRYAEKNWPAPSWLDFQRYETTIGRNFIKTRGLKHRTSPKPIPPIKTLYYKACEKFAQTLTYKQKLELKILSINED